MAVLSFSLAGATSLQINDGLGTWYAVDLNSLTVVTDPSFTDPVTGALTTPGDQWIQWTTSGQAYAAPYRAVAALKLMGPATSMGGGTGPGGPL